MSSTSTKLLPKYPPDLSSPRQLMSYDEWLKRTGVLGLTRSPELKAVDESLKNYNGTHTAKDLKALIDWLNTWKAKEGPGDAWKKSARNRSHAVELLTSQIWGGDNDRFNVPYFMVPELVHSRLGVIYLLKSLDVDTGFFEVVLEGGLNVVGGALNFAGNPTSQHGLGKGAANIASAVISPVMVPGSNLLNAGVDSAGSAKVPQSPALVSLAQKVRSWLADFTQKMIATMKEKFGNIEFPASLIKNLLSGLLGVFLQNVAPFVGAGMDIAKGMINVIDASMVRFRSWYLGRNVSLVVGHPGAVVSSIHRAMTMSLFEGLYTTLKGAANAALAGSGVAAWGTLILNLVTAISEAIAKVVWRLFEIFKMKHCFAEAGEEWNKRNSGNALQKRPFAFSEWYSKYALVVPAIAILTLNSGICGDKMAYISLFETDQLQGNVQLAQLQPRFDAGVKYLDDLKPWGAEYLSKSGFSFSSNDEFVSKIIKFSVMPANQRDFIWRVVRQVANA